MDSDWSRRSAEKRSVNLTKTLGTTKRPSCGFEKLAAKISLLSRLKKAPLHLATPLAWSHDATEGVGSTHSNEELILTALAPKEGDHHA